MFLFEADKVDRRTATASSIMTQPRNLQTGKILEPNKPLGVSGVGETLEDLIMFGLLLRVWEVPLSKRTTSQQRRGSPH